MKEQGSTSLPGFATGMFVDSDGIGIQDSIRCVFGLLNGWNPIQFCHNPSNSMVDGFNDQKYTHYIYNLYMVYLQVYSPSMY